ncbi:recombinase RecF [Mycobacterium celatum]|uniref:Nuclease SbcCD subunit C n=1 Tax=Mycobacterium celatum TaxID=28045 RepID=A0A1X1RN21_MYCCE|nr:recombinase RecF [Mycobacterium celatum]
MLEMLEDDFAVDTTVKDVVLEALAEIIGQTVGSDEADPAATFLTAISVEGFRGIGPAARLDLYPAPGLMVVSGRNGCGKSSFAEAIELALTGTSYRWRNKEALWAETWRNLHHSNPCEILIGFTREGTGPFTVGMEWEAEDSLTARTSWTQTGTEKRVEGTDGLGWSRPLEVYRPVLSYDELGRLFDGGPSVLYDALAKVLGLEVLADTEKWLAAKLKETKDTRSRADHERKRLLTVLAEHTDERAERASTLLRKRSVPTDEVLALATGAGDAQLQVVPVLRALTNLETPTLDEVEAATSRLRSAAQAAAHAATAVIDLADQRVELLQDALRFHDHAGDTECPVCGQGQLDADWAMRTRDFVARSQGELAEYRSATKELTAARSVATALLTGLRSADEISGVDLPAVPGYNRAVTAAKQVPADDNALADHLESKLTNVIAAAETLRAEADAALARRESAWAPLAAQLGGWVRLEEQARDLDSTVKTLTDAKKWVADHAGLFRNLRLKPIAAQARHIWSQLRQESNVDLDDITLEGTANRRKVVLGGSVDGEPTKALSVMSQGELHALALALFLPRATTAKSPFRFVVLDDPIQAMDPAKIDGFVRVLSEIAQTHQVVVFSHDDRLASVIRETGADARMVEVVRETGSRITLRDNVNPALRQVSDVFALIKDDRMPDDVKKRVAPGLFRMALESAARQAYYTKQALAGRPRAESEERWLSAKKTATRLALVVHGDPAADLTSWLDAKPARRRSLKISNAVHGNAGAVSIEDARDLERTVAEVLALR